MHVKEGQMEINKVLHKIHSYIYTCLFNHRAWVKREKRKHYGKENPDKIFYIITFEDKQWGACSTWKYVLQHLDYAFCRGYIPYVDLKKGYCACMQSITKKHKENAWDIYFSQCCEYVPEEIYHSKNVVIGYKDSLDGYDDIVFPMTEEEIHKWHGYAEKIKCKADIDTNAEEYIASAFPHNETVLGVDVRFEYDRCMELKATVVEGHFIQPGLLEIIEAVKEKMRMWKCNYCFWVVDDEEAFEKIKQIFGEKCLAFPRKRITTYINGKPVSITNCDKMWKSNDIEKQTTDYLTELEILSKCDCLLAGNCTGAVYAAIKNDGQYRQTYIYDKGNYHIK